MLYCSYIPVDLWLPHDKRWGLVVQYTWTVAVLIFSYCLTLFDLPVGLNKNLAFLKVEIFAAPQVVSFHNFWRLIYYILNKEIQEFLIKIKMLFLRCLERFISSREINPCRLDTFPIMVTNRPYVYDRVPGFGLLLIPLCSCSYTQVSNRHELPFCGKNKQTDAVSEMVNFISKPRAFFRRVELNAFMNSFISLNAFMNSFISCGMAWPHIIDASYFAIR